ncbi:TonB dependent receptor [compost metagenome]
MMFGLSSTLSWKQFDLNFLVQGAAQRNLMLQGTGRVLYAGGGASGNFAYLEDSWTPDNVNAEYPIAWTDARSINNRNSTFWLKGAGYVRLKSASLGYTLDNTWLHKNGISKIRVYLSGFNLLTWSQIKQFDPEVSAGNGLYYPQQQNFNLGINLTL